jgi:hypothetical protein
MLVTMSDNDATKDSLTDALLWALEHRDVKQFRYEFELKTSPATRVISKVRITLYRDKKGRVDIFGDGLEAPGLASAIQQVVPGWSTRGRRWFRRLPHVLAARVVEILVGVIVVVLGGVLLAALL